MGVPVRPAPPLRVRGSLGPRVTPLLAFLVISPVKL